MSPKDVDTLIKKALEAVRFARAPYSGFKVGSAVLSADGRIFTGANIENPSLMLSACAERVALLKAISEGADDLKAIAIACADGLAPCYPCGGCRQMLYEFAPDMKIILPTKKSIKVMTLGELLPYPFVKD